MKATQRQTGEFLISKDKLEVIKSKMLNWSKQFEFLLFLDSNEFEVSGKQYECLLATGVKDFLVESSAQPDFLGAVDKLHQSNKDWMFGHFCYDFKNRLETNLQSHHSAKSGFAEAYFFIPETVCYINRDKNLLTISSFSNPNQIFQEIDGQPVNDMPPLTEITFKLRADKEVFLKNVEKIRQHIYEGDCYELNYCIEGFCEDVLVTPYEVFKRLNSLSSAPFAAFYRNGNSYLMCSSPERYLKKSGDKIISQPIKGTARRSMDVHEDEAIKLRLKSDTKELAENVMIVDLVRNDLARVCEPGSVVVEELFGVYTFPQVHQLISTVCGKMKKGLPLTDALKCTFPMGSMTGAPKYKVMQLIEKYEFSRRELYSGTVGYITPWGDIDFNVVIRSLFYNAQSKYLSYQTGGAITYDSDPEKEWEELRLKAWALERIFRKS